MEARQPARYEEIAGYLRGLVAVADPGDRLPSDAELCERFAVSRMTARHAVQVLANEQLLERRRGTGTFVSAHRVPRLLGSPLSFTESMRARGMTASSALLHRGPVAANDDERAALGLAAGENAYLLERLRLADSVPMAIERVVMPAGLVESLDRDIETGSLHAAFEAVGRIPSVAHAEVTARKASRRERELLALVPSGVVLSEHRTISDQDRRPLERTITVYAAERYSFEAVLYRDPTEGGR